MSKELNKSSEVQRLCKQVEELVQNARSENCPVLAEVLELLVPKLPSEVAQCLKDKQKPRSGFFYPLD